MAQNRTEAPRERSTKRTFKQPIGRHRSHTEREWRTIAREVSAAPDRIKRGNQVTEDREEGFYSNRPSQGIRSSSEKLIEPRLSSFRWATDDRDRGAPCLTVPCCITTAGLFSARSHREPRRFPENRPCRDLSQTRQLKTRTCTPGSRERMCRGQRNKGCVKENRHVAGSDTVTGNATCRKRKEKKFSLLLESKGRSGSVVWE